MAERTLTLDVGDGLTLAVVAEQAGPQLVADQDIVARLTNVTRSIEVVGRETLDAVRRAGPEKAKVELGFGLAVEEGQLVALLGRGRAEAAIRVTVTWCRAGTE